MDHPSLPLLRFKAVLRARTKCWLVTKKVLVDGELDMEDSSGVRVQDPEAYRLYEGALGFLARRSYVPVHPTHIRLLFWTPTPYRLVFLVRINTLTSTSLCRPGSSSLFEHFIPSVELPVELPHYLAQCNTQTSHAHFITSRDNGVHRPILHIPPRCESL